MVNEIKQIKQIINNLKKYAIKNECIFKATKWLSDCDDYLFIDRGFTLHFRINETLQ